MLVVFGCMLLLCTACGGAGGAGSSPKPAESDAAAGSAAGTSSSATGAATPAGDGASVEKSFGTYAIPENWFEVDEWSRSDYSFILHDGSSLDSPTSNISVSEGTNRYGVDQAVEFAHDIDVQLAAQATSDVTSYDGRSSYTDNGDPLIVMTMGFEDGSTIFQYYIVGDHRHVMVYATDFGDGRVEGVEDAALAIVNSFVWAD